MGTFLQYLLDDILAFASRLHGECTTSNAQRSYLCTKFRDSVLRVFPGRKSSPEQSHRHWELTSTYTIIDHIPMQHGFYPRLRGGNP